MQEWLKNGTDASPYVFKYNRFNMDGFKAGEPTKIISNISKQDNLVVSASGFVDKSKTEGFNAGLHYLQLNANIFTSPPKYSPEADPNVIGIIEMSVDPAVEKTRYTPQTID